MKFSVFTAFICIFILMIFLVFKLPLWFYLLVVMLPLAVIIIYFSFIYSFRKSVVPQSVPEKGYDDRLAVLKEAETKLVPIGFEKFDQFHLKMIPDSVTFAFKHTREPIYCCVYHFGQKMTCDMVTYFNYEVSLTTCSSIDGGASPRAPKSLLQIFHGATYDTLLAQHLYGIGFLKQNRFDPVEIPAGSFRDSFMKEIREYAERIRKIPLWPVMLLIWTLSKYGKRYAKPLQEQYPNGISHIFQTGPRLLE